jgi:hypothetical protein
MYFADFDGMGAVPQEHLARGPHVLAHKRLDRVLPHVGHGFGDRNLHLAATRQNP